MPPERTFREAPKLHDRDHSHTDWRRQVGVRTTAAIIREPRLRRVELAADARGSAAEHTTLRDGRADGRGSNRRVLVRRRGHREKHAAGPPDAHADRRRRARWWIRRLPLRTAA